MSLYYARLSRLPGMERWVRLAVIADNLIVLGRAGQRTGVTWRREGLGATHRSRTIEMNGRDGDRNRSPLRIDASSVIFATGR
jgi:hypothetical protein